MVKKNFFLLQSFLCKCPGMKLRRVLLRRKMFYFKTEQKQLHFSNVKPIIFSIGFKNESEKNALTT